LTIWEKLQPMNDTIQTQLNRIEEQIRNHFLQTKEVFTFNEFCTYCGISKSYGYKLTSMGKVPHYKPCGKLVYFKRTEIEDWLLSNLVKTDEQLEKEALEYLNRN
jgi:excisionase family DNA binding protein